MTKKTTQLKQMITSSNLEFLMEAHNGISAKIVEEAGFKGIWGSGLSISAALGVRDNNEASWTQVLDVVEFMSDATSIPILLDGDTGYGNFNNMRRLVKKLEQRGIAGVCIEDKIFPKTNSFLRGNAQPLADIEEFSGKIKAGKDSQTDDDFVIAARVEAFIAGWGLQEALKRAEAYYEAGADAILMHSKLSQPTEIFAFMKEWGERCPVIIVPTKYYSTPTDQFREHKVSVAIWANHIMRGAIQKMQDIAREIYTEENLLGVEDKIVSVSDVFRLQGDDELKEAEKLYLQKQETYSAVVLAVWQGKPLGKVTQDIPKTMVKIGPTSILEKMITSFQSLAIQNITVVAGYKKEAITVTGIKLVENANYKTTGQMVSLEKGLGGTSQKTIVLFGDILFRKYIVQLLIDNPADIVLAVDSAFNVEQSSQKSDYVRATTSDKKVSYDREVLLKEIDYAEPNSSYNGEWIGIMKLSENGMKEVRQFIEQHQNDPAFEKMAIRDMLNHFVESHEKVSVEYITGHWMDVDTAIDLNLASNF
jgi:phosphoenolpyruvate phosphomutase